MKKTTIFVGLLTLSLTACQDKFLELAPVSSINTSTYYQTQSDILTALNGAYGALQFAGQYGQNYVLTEIPSDDSYPVLSGTVTDQDQLDKFYLITTNPYTLAAWERWLPGYLPLQYRHRSHRRNYDARNDQKPRHWRSEIPPGPDVF